MPFVGFLLPASCFEVISPTPVIEWSAEATEMLSDLKAVLEDHFDRLVVPQDNLLDVNYCQLQHFFPAHPMFENSNKVF
jgi:hypothetical protein